MEANHPNDLKSYTYSTLLMQSQELAQEFQRFVKEE
jgi:hypothetical protein